MKTRHAFRYLALATSAMLIGWYATSNADDGRNNTDAADIKASATRWAEAYNRGDLDTVVALYTDDARLLPEGSEAIVGRAAILEFFKKMQATQPGQIVSFSNFEFYGRDPTVTEASEVEIRDRNGKLLSRGKQVLIRMKQGGEWKIHRDIWTGNGVGKAKP
jgi:uncharacterized protein (TIGR02246 family)